MVLIKRQPGYTSPQSGVSVQAEDGNVSNARPSIVNM